MNIYYNENDIIDIRNTLNFLKGKILMDNNGDLFILNDYYIESVTRTKGIFKKREVTEFLIKRIEFTSGTKDYVHEDDMMCSSTGVGYLMDWHSNWTALQAKLIRFSIDTGMPLNFSSKFTAR